MHKIIQDIKNGNLDAIEYMSLEEVNNLRFEDERSLLHIAADNGNLQLVDLLIRKKAEMNPEDSMGCTPMHLAAAKGNLEILKCLYKAGSNPNFRNNMGLTSLDYAINSESIESALWLYSVQKISDTKFNTVSLIFKMENLIFKDWGQMQEKILVLLKMLDALCKPEPINDSRIHRYVAQEYDEDDIENSFARLTKVIEEFIPVLQKFKQKFEGQNIDQICFAQFQWNKCINLCQKIQKTLKIPKTSSYENLVSLGDPIFSNSPQFFRPNLHSALEKLKPELIELSKEIEHPKTELLQSIFGDKGNEMREVFYTVSSILAPLLDPKSMYHLSLISKGNHVEIENESKRLKTADETNADNVVCENCPVIVGDNGIKPLVDD